MMRRVVILGRGGAGKSVLARRLGELTALPVTELDRVFWSADLQPTSRDAWEDVQRKLTMAEGWVLDGDLGPYDSLQPRLAAADTVVVLDFGLLRCAWRALRRSPERADFWWWLLRWRGVYKRQLVAAVARWAPGAQLHILRTPRQAERFLAEAASESR